MENKDNELQEIMDLFDCDEEEAKEIAECVDVVKGELPF